MSSEQQHWVSCRDTTEARGEVGPVDFNLSNADVSALPMDGIHHTAVIRQKAALGLGELRIYSAASRPIYFLHTIADHFDAEDFYCTVNAAAGTTCRGLQ